MLAVEKMRQNSKLLSMGIKDIRKIYHLSQKKASALLGIPYRTFQRYEEDESYRNSYKYRFIEEELSRRLLIDEKHGVLSIDSIKEKILPILKKHRIKSCYLFGSYARGDAKEESDIDLLIDTELTGLDFFKLVEEIRTSTNKKIDLLRLCDLSSNNPIILEILKDGIKIL